MEDLRMWWVQISNLFRSFYLLAQLYYYKNLIEKASIPHKTTQLFFYFDLTGAHHMISQESSTVCTDTAKHLWIAKKNVEVFSLCNKIIMNLE